MAEWWRGAVIYQIYPRSFADANGDGIGDLKGITERLDYVASLGVDGIWLSPFFTSPMVDFGYDVADYRDVDPMFGTLADFDATLARAHALGLKVIIDQVYSHTSDQHPWFAESRQDTTNPKADWYVWAEPKDDGTPPNNWLSHFGGPAWTWDARRRQYYLHNFASAQPDLNFHNPEVRAAILDVARFWLDRGVDGFRLDTGNIFFHDRHLRDNPAGEWHEKPVSPYDFQRHLYNIDQPESLEFAGALRGVLDEYDDRMAVAEIVTERGVEMMVQYTAGPARYHTAYSFVFLGRRFDTGFIRATVEEDRDEGPESWPSWALSNHDSIRTISRWAPEDTSPAKAKCLLALLVCLRGTAFVYQGEELGLAEADVPFEAIVDPVGRAFWPENKGRDGCRTPMPWSDQDGAGFCPPEATPWLPIDPAQRSRAVSVQEGDEGSVLAFFRRLLDWRRGEPLLRTGDIDFLNMPEPVLTLRRLDGHGSALICLFNLSGKPVAVPGLDEGATAQCFSHDAEAKEGTVGFGPWGVAVFRQA